MGCIKISEIKAASRSYVVPDWDFIHYLFLYLNFKLLIINISASFQMKCIWLFGLVEGSGLHRVLIISSTLASVNRFSDCRLLYEVEIPEGVYLEIESIFVMLPTIINLVNFYLLPILILRCVIQPHTSAHQFRQKSASRSPDQENMTRRF
uniref:Transmembrane protein n=1 Tax=Angiostrongylus cantonensis TaxID=6313 RepID=A0A0K0DMS7_ANGCA